MHTAGTGSELWRVRVDLLTGGRTPNPLVSTCSEELLSALGIEGGRWKPGEIGVDCGIGVEGQPVVGFLFWVRADDVGDAAMTAVATARRAGAPADVGPDLYDVIVIPDAAVATDGKSYPRMAD